MAASKKWILLRGLARGRGHWGTFAQRIQAHFPEDQFEFIDLPGNGERQDVASPLQVSDYVAEVRERSQFVKDGEPFQILAVSLGAMVAVEWMRQFPLEVRKAYLVCTSSGSLSPFYDRYQMQNFIPTLGLACGADPIRWEQTVLSMVTNSKERRESEYPGLLSYTQQNPQKTSNVLRQLIAASRFKMPQQIPGEVQLIGSFGDRLVSPHCTLKLAEHWGLKAAMHPWAGHDIPIDDPQWLIEHLL